ncbi:MAG: hypothetical protein OXN84_01680 [Albidovulum sp.]|nr:hypothetical protein [Albidovulum sp.]
MSCYASSRAERACIVIIPIASKEILPPWSCDNSSNIEVSTTFSVAMFEALMMT